MEDYPRSLEVEADVRKIDKADQMQVVQISAETNNLT